jgi:hypothetical protein
MFDPSLGVLNKATVNFSGGGVTGLGSVQNSAIFALHDITINVSGDFDATLSAAGPSALSTVVHLFASGSPIGGVTFTTLGAGATTTLGPFAKSSDPAVQTFVFTTSSDLAGFSGLGKFGYDFFTKTFANVLGAHPTVSASVSSLSSAMLSVEYDYTPSPSPVPEPTSWAMLLAGLLGASGLVLRRKGALVPVTVSAGV